MKGEKYVKGMKKVGKKLLFPPVWVMLLLTVFSTVSLVLIFVKGLEEAPVAYAIYVISFYTLSVICILCGIVLPKRYRAIKQKVYDHPLGNRYMTDVQFKNHVSLYCSLAVNLLYVGTNAASAIYYATAWFAIFAVYCTISGEKIYIKVTRKSSKIKGFRHLTNA